MKKPLPLSTAWLLEGVGGPEHNRKMFRLSMGGALVGIVTATWSAAVIDTLWLRAPVVALNVLCCGTNAMMAGKWARRMEEEWFERLYRRRPWEN